MADPARPTGADHAPRAAGTACSSLAGLAPGLLDGLVACSPDGIVAADRQGRVLLYNGGAERILGYTREQALSGLTVSKLVLEGTARELMRRLRSDGHGGRGRLARHEVVAVARDGQHVPVSLTGGILYDPAGEEVASLWTFRDLRALHAVHDRLLQAEKMAGLGRLAAGVAHEINNPLAGIMLFAGFALERLGPDHPASADVRTIQQQAERCRDIVADLLDFSQHPLRGHTTVSLQAAVQSTIGVLAVQPLFARVRFEQVFPEALPPIWGDASRIEQVLSNLFVNAAQAMDGDGVITVSGRVRARGDVVALTVADTGCGIDPEHLRLIFDPFFTTKADRGGTGLGLSVCYAIVKEHKGTVRAESTPGRGTTFHLRFPAVQHDPAPAREGELAGVGGSGSGSGDTRPDSTWAHVEGRGNHDEPQHPGRR